MVFLGFSIVFPRVFLQFCTLPEFTQLAIRFPLLERRSWRAQGSLSSRRVPSSPPSSTPVEGVFVGVPFVSCLEVHQGAA